ncbi:hypothetical protein QRB32_09430 [Mycobacterium intracellulare subsp. chimaera]|uniref:hypothetical protein n=1 Tax=Mycobacterium intracellulare TaxID=1767 RepID=UPI00259B37AA|nr:hypothetical protein [Mycobacterium intracellulare]MDM3932420.1 hypothetical protein [Mycobacterium intracellulare subsp. chimaera]
MGAGAYRGGTTADTLSWSHAIAGPCVVMAVAYQQNSPTLPTLTPKVGGVAMTRLGANANYYSVSGYYIWALLFGLIGAPTGSGVTVSIAASANQQYWVANSVSYKNVSSFGTPQFTGNGAASTPSHAVSADTRQLIVQAFAGWNGFGTYNQAQRFNSPFNPGGSQVKPLIIGDAPGAGTVNFSTTGTELAWGSAAVALNT